MVYYGYTGHRRAKRKARLHHVTPPINMATTSTTTSSSTNHTPRTMPPASRPGKSNALLRFQRELNGTKYVPNPRPPPQLPSYRIDHLEPTLSIRHYTVVDPLSTFSPTTQLT